MADMFLTDQEFEIFLNIILDDNPEFFSNDFLERFHGVEYPRIYISISMFDVEIRSYDEHELTFGGLIFSDGDAFQIDGVAGLERLHEVLVKQLGNIDVRFTRSHIERYSEVMRTIESAIGL